MKERLIINGGKSLKGEIDIPLSKNAILPIMAAALLIDGKTIIKKIPHITDIDNLSKLLENYGAEINIDDNDMHIDASTIDICDIDKNTYGKIRSSVFLIGAMLGRCKKVHIYSAGGCCIGSRPIDIHLSALQSMGAEIIDTEDGMIIDGICMHSDEVYLPYPSVGATENIIMSATLLAGETVIYNAAREPEVADLCNFLVKAGAKIQGIGSSIIRIQGVDKLYSTAYEAIPDRIIAGTIMCGVAACGGDVVLRNINISHIKNIITPLKQMGCQIKTKGNRLQIINDGKLLGYDKIVTGPYPEFPTDMQSIMLVLSSMSSQSCIIDETVFENRYRNIDNITKAGGVVKLIDNIAITTPTNVMSSNTFCAYDLRSGASIVILAMSMNGTSIIKDIHHIDRGYPQIESLFNAIGADIIRE